MGDVISLRQFFDNTDEQEHTGRGRVCTRRGSPYLYVDFHHAGHRVCLSTGRPDTPENEREVRAWLDRVLLGLEAGAISFEDAIPGAPQALKEAIARSEGRQMPPADPSQVTLGAYTEKWRRQILARDPSLSKQRDYERILEDRVLPYWKDRVFREINGVEVKKFVLQMVHERGPKKGELLSGSRIRNVLTVLRHVWTDACEENGWDLRDPFEYLRRQRHTRLIPKKAQSSPQVFRFEEWQRLLASMDRWYRPIAEFMMLTGCIASEVAGLRWSDIEQDKILVQNSIVGDLEKGSLKTAYRARAIPLTAAIRRQLDLVRGRSRGKYPFRMRSGRAFESDNFRKNAWARAIRRAGLPARVPYAVRHTFAAWSLTAGMHPERLVRLMGHGSKKMIYEVYGRYVEGLESDAGMIRDYFGKDFLGLEKRHTPDCLIPPAAPRACDSGCDRGGYRKSK
ncbi:MAG: tyrosine-type recombinase/integrase [Thermodesulfobacteriota bacterium]